MQQETPGGPHVRSCPLCRQDQLHREALALHLTERHSVLPVCLDWLLDAVIPEQEDHSEGKAKKNKVTQQICLEDAEGLKKEDLKQHGERFELPETYELYKSPVKNNQTIGQNPSDLEQVQFLSTRRLPKCGVCPEVFSSQSQLSIHHNSASHLCQMPAESLENSENDWFCLGQEVGQSPPYISSKPYQCAVSRVSCDHSITLGSHLRPVLHQTCSRCTEGSSSSTAENVRSSENNTLPKTHAVNSVTHALHAVATGSHDAQGNVSASAVTPEFSLYRKQLPLTQHDSLLSPPVASAQTVSPVVSFLTPSSQFSSLHSASTSASSIILPQVTSQQQLFFPLFLSSLQTENLNADAPGQVLTLGLNSAQVLLTQRACGLQSLGSSVELSTALSAPSEEKVQAGDIAEGVNVTVKEDDSSRVKMESHVANLSVKHEGRKCPGFDCLLKCRMKGDTKAAENNGMAGENIIDTNNYGNGMQLRESRNGKVLVSGAPYEVVSQNPLSFQAAPDETHTKSNLLACGMSPSNSTSLSLTNLKFMPGPCSSLGEAHSDTKSNQCLTDDLMVVPVDTHNELTSHFTLSGNDSESSPMTIQDLSGTYLKSSSPEPLTLSEFQSQLLWAFLESRSQANVASPSQEDCGELAREMGLSVEEVHRWLGDVQGTKDRQNDIEGKDGICGAFCRLVECREIDILKTDHVKNICNNGESEGELHGDSCQTTKMDSGEFCTAVNVTDVESQSSLEQDKQSNPTKVENHAEKVAAVEGKVLYSPAEFTSDEDERNFGKMKTKLFEKEQLNIKKQKLDVDAGLQLGTRADSPAFSFQQGNLCRITDDDDDDDSLPLSIAPLIARFLNPHVLSLPPLPVDMGIFTCEKSDKGKQPDLLYSLASCPSGVPLTMPHLPAHECPSQTLSGRDDSECALDLSIGKNYIRSVSASFSSPLANAKIPQKDQLFRNPNQGFGLDASETGSLKVHGRAKCTLGIRSSIDKSNRHTKATEHVNSRKREKEGKSEWEEAMELSSLDLKRLKGRPRTIIQPQQLDVLYGCYFKDPNPGKHEFERISEWVKLPKKVVQIWFQNMRSRVRKGEVRFIGNGTLAAVGKPLIKFTWPISPPILSSLDGKCGSAVANNGPVNACVKRSLCKDVEKMNRCLTDVEPMTSCSSNASSLTVSRTGTHALFPKAKSLPKASNFSVPFAIIDAHPPHSPQKCRRDKGDELHGKVEEKSDKEDASESHITEPGSRNPLVLKIPQAPVGKHSDSQKHNGLNTWTPKGAFNMNPLSKKQLRLNSHNNTPRTIAPLPVVTCIPKMQCNNLQHCIPHRPRTLITSLQLSILQSCYEICPHPNAQECKAVASELKLPQRVVQIWFQNTRAKEKRWRLQQAKQCLDAKDLSNKVDVSSSSYLQYRARRTNRPILPRPIQFMLVEPSTPSDADQLTSNEALRGMCEICGVGLESRAAGRVHVFSPQHLATIRAACIGQLSSSIGSRTISGMVVVSSSQSPLSSMN